MRFVMALCDEIYVVATGELIDHGTPDKVRANPRSSRLIWGRGMLEVRDLTAAYGGIVAVRGMNLTVAPGKCVALIGSNGAGKTTLLHTICGLMPPVLGSILFRDANIAGDAAYRVARRGILLVPEGRQILAPLSVRENLELGHLALAIAPERALCEPRRGARSVSTPRRAY